MQKRICEYIKKNVRGQREIVGVMIGEIDENEVVRIGWSKTATTKGDVFNKTVAYMIADERLKAKTTVPCPHSIAKDMFAFKSRCRRYFQNTQFMPLISVKR